jgi:hypothetical protein
MRAEAYPRLARRCTIAAETAPGLAPHVALDTIKRGALFAGTMLR